MSKDEKSGTAAGNSIKNLTANTPISIAQPINRLFGLSGRAGSGKDTVAKILKTLLPNHKVETMSFAWMLRLAIEVLTASKLAANNTVTAEQKQKKIPFQAFGDTEETVHKRLCYMFTFLTGKDKWDAKILSEAAAILAKECGDILHPDITVGRLLQIVGTDISRKLLGENVFTDPAELTLQKFAKDTIIIFTDVRLENEQKMIVANGGIIIGLFTGARPIGVADGRRADHITETASGIVPSIVLDNSGDIDRLKIEIEKKLLRGGVAAPANK